MFTVGKMQKCKIAAESAERPPTCNTSTHYTRNDIYNILRVYRYVAAAASKVTTPLALHSILFGKLLGISVAILAVYLVTLLVLTAEVWPDWAANWGSIPCRGR